MIICGVELTGSDAVICLLHLDREQFTIPDCRVRKLSLKKEHTREELQQFQFAFAKLLSDYSVDEVAIKGRITKGRFAGGAVSFKLEATLQLIPDTTVVLLTSSQIKSALKEKPLLIPFSETDLKVFQEGAFTVAYAAHVLK